MDYNHSSWGSDMPVDVTCLLNDTKTFNTWSAVAHGFAEYHYILVIIVRAHICLVFSLRHVVCSGL